MVLRRRVGMRDWVLAVVVVSIAQITGVNAIDWVPFFILLGVAVTALCLWGFVFPRLAPANALTLEAWMNAGTALAAAFLVAVSLGPESPVHLLLRAARSSSSRRSSSARPCASR